MELGQSFTLADFEDVEYGQRIKWKCHNGTKSEGKFYGIRDGKVLIQAMSLYPSNRRTYQVKPERVLEVG